MAFNAFALSKIVDMRDMPNGLIEEIGLLYVGVTRT